jgi:AcrR family transcriptional regulator
VKRHAEAQIPGTVEIDPRPRLLAAFTKLASERGYSRVEIATVCRYAGVPRTVFDEYFTSAEDALLAAQEVFLRRLWLEIEAACEAAGEWPTKIRAAVVAVIDALVESSASARVFAIEAPGASLAAASLQFSALDRLADRLREGRRRYPRAENLPDATERSLIGGTVSIVSQHLLAENASAISCLQAQLVELLLSPYLGEEQARLVAAA